MPRLRDMQCFHLASNKISRYCIQHLKKKMESSKREQAEFYYPFLKIGSKQYTLPAPQRPYYPFFPKFFKFF
ncbi:unnamed protein product [Cuscuta campestris]|uniref:Uncharacterized protein n=1 Tax=Cuscuta campestris TaxID=132261 RepID=A0A484LRN2_9ASTE|nr:unnamed protein product [Cuscuta campestris]